LGTISYIGIGSNLGNRRKNIERAIKSIDRLKDTSVIKTSRIIETEPVGLISQGKFLNAVLKISTNFPPRTLLGNLQKIERQLGRPNNHARNSPRTIDLDILFYADELINTKDLRVPHPRIGEREFVIKPLLEVI